MKVTDEYLDKVWKMANKLIDDKGYFSHIQKWHVEYTLKAQEVLKQEGRDKRGVN